MLIHKIITRLRGILDDIRRELLEWFRAFLSSIPGEIGCFLRNRFYGFRPEKGVRVLAHVVVYYPRNLSIGKTTGIAAQCQLNAAGGIEIGDNVLIGPGAIIWSQSHSWENAEILIRDQGWKRKPIVIDDDVWIGAGAIVLPGVHLAEGTVVAAGAVVTKSTKPYTLVAGTPARPIGRRGEGSLMRETSPTSSSVYNS
jgi:acetyltransferase-like isoleucine patch superfamily enzyme